MWERPFGVPVRMRSFSSSVMNSLMYAMIAGMSLTKSRVLPSWRSSPLTKVRTPTLSGSGRSSRSIIQGPTGVKVSKPLALTGGR